MKLFQKFVEISGSAESRIMIIPNAGSEPKRSSELQQEEFAKYGGNSDYLLFDRETADNQENLDKMDWANAVFFLGGDQSDLTKDMLGTKLLQKVFDIYNSGGVVGGSSAGAAVMSKIMITGNELINKDSTRYYVTIEKNNIETVEGFGFLNTVIIDQHFLMRKRLNRLISVVLENPDKLGVGLDESNPG
ncbi:MAG: cyanophycinase [Melioribacteraceae bacterium]|nr:cyanophycinase [Melioribacteraceae bacterium]